MLDFRNINTLWSSIIVETLYRLGLRETIICPGSRSSPLTIAFANHNKINKITILDERSAAFFALGRAKKTGIPVALVCTSGSAGANFYPAIIEGKYSGVPLLILTADRPPELLNCHAGQTINQINLYGKYPHWELQLSTPNSDIKLLNYLRQNLIIAYEKSLFPNKGIVHINIPLREPLSPVIDHNILTIKNNFNNELFFNNIKPVKPEIKNVVELPLNLWQKEEKGLIIGGLKSPENGEKYSQAIAKISQYLNYPVLGEALSPLRNYASLNPNLITNYDFILRNQEFREKFAPKIVIQVGELPTSKILREWLDNLNPQRWIINPVDDNFDPLHGQTIHLRTTIENIVDRFFDSPLEKASNNNYLKIWLEIDKKVGKKVNQKLSEIEEIIEAKITGLLCQNLPPETPLFIANSMPIRYMEYFWQSNNKKITPYFSRGTNGIDGTLSTALGIAYHNKPTVMLTGDLALLHDTNGFLIGQKFKGHLTIILVNNNGGGIFEMLPIADFEDNFKDNFEEYFATPQNINFERLCATYNVEYKLVQSWSYFTQLISNLPSHGIRLLEIQTNRKNDAQWLRENLPNFANFQR